MLSMSLTLTSIENALAVTRSQSHMKIAERAEKNPSEKTSNKITEIKPNVKEISKKSASSEKSKKTIAEKKSSEELKPLTIETAATISNKLPDYFSRWLKGDKSTSTLTYKDILKLINERDITGQEAAVLGAIITYINGLSDPNSSKLTLSQLQNLFNSDTGSIYSWYYNTAITNLNSERTLPESQKLFGSNGINSNTQIIQNGLGDCFALSSINGMLNHPDGPQKLQDMITSISGHPDEYYVKFPGYDKPILVVYTPTKEAMYSELVDGGRWLAIMSDAIARARRDNPESGIFVGGYQTFILHLLTGKDYRNEALSPFSPQQVEMLKNLNDTQLTALENLLTGSTTKLLTNQLQNLSSLTTSQLQAALTKDQLKEFQKLTSEQLAMIQSLTAAQWDEVTTLIYSNKGNINRDLLEKSLKANRSNSDISDQLNQALNVDNPPHIIGIETTEHDLTIIGYDPSTGMLTIKNPWGDSGWYNPVTGGGPDKNMPKNGSSPPWYNMTNGVFTASLSNLVASNFVTITIPIRHDDSSKATKTASENSTTQVASKSWDQQVSTTSNLVIPKNIQESAKHLTTTIQDNWSTWTNGQDTLTITRIGQLISDPSTTGKEAAALGALVDYFYKLNRSVTSLSEANSVDAFTLPQLQAALSDLSGHNRVNEVFADDYRLALIQIKDDTTKDGFSLFGKKNPPQFGENIQWNVCDCYFVSAVNALLKQDPNKIVQMIKQTGPDTFEVYFPGYKDGKTPVTITLTQGDIAMFSHTRDGGVYLAVLGRATDKVMRMEGSDSNPVANQTPIGTVVDTGSHWVERNTFNLLTGKQYTQIKIQNYSTDQLEKLIDYATKHHEFVGLGAGFSPISVHYLLITGIHNGMVDVLNPWGVTGWYAPTQGGITYLPDSPKPTGTGAVFKMKDGHFEVPLKDIVADGFGSMTFQDESLKKAQSS